MRLTSVSAVSPLCPQIVILLLSINILVESNFGSGVVQTKNSCCTFCPKGVRKRTMVLRLQPGQILSLDASLQKL